MGQRFYDRIMLLARVRYGTASDREILSRLLADVNRLRADAAIPAKRLIDHLTGRPDEDWLDECLAIALDVDREDLYFPPNTMETKRRFFDYGGKLGKAPADIKESWPKFINGAGYRREDGDLEKPLDGRHFRAFFAEQGQTYDANSGEERQLELGL